MGAITVADGTPVVWAHGDDWGAGAHGFGEESYEIDLTALADNAGRQGVKGDLGATRAPTYAVVLGIEAGASAPTKGEVIELWWSSSSSATAGTGNDGGASGADGAYAAGGEAELNEWKVQLSYIGQLAVTADAAGVVQIKTVNEAFIPPRRYGMPVVLNYSGQALDGDATNMFIAFIPTSVAAA